MCITIEFYAHVGFPELPAQRDSIWLNILWKQESFHKEVSVLHSKELGPSETHLALDIN